MTFVTYTKSLEVLLLVQEASMYKLHNDDCLNVLCTYPENYFDSIVADPPAGISFMGKDWDHDKGGRDQWIAWMTSIAAECLRTLKPGGHALIWSLPRTSHWTATAWENAGFEVRDRIGHIFGSGFPKSYNVSKGIEGILTNGSASWNDFHKLSGEVGKSNSSGANGLVSTNKKQGNRPTQYESHGTLKLEPTTPEAEQWNGWGTALKPAVEDWWLFRKPCSEKTVAANVLKCGTGALNIDACRIPGKTITNKLERWSGFGQVDKPDYVSETNDKGRWPAHLIHDGSEEVLNVFPENESSDNVRKNNRGWGDGIKFGKGNAQDSFGYKDSGSASRFFYCAKPTQEERNLGAKKGNNHPTVKALALMKYLITLITPPKGIVLDFCMGSGSTGVAAILLGFGFVGIEKDTEYGYFDIAEQRIKNTPEPML